MNHGGSQLFWGRNGRVTVALWWFFPGFGVFLDGWIGSFCFSTGFCLDFCWWAFLVVVFLVFYLMKGLFERGFLRWLQYWISRQRFPWEVVRPCERKNRPIYLRSPLGCSDPQPGTLVNIQS